MSSLPNDHPDNGPTLQFGLRTMLALIVLFSVLFAMLSVLSRTAASLTAGFFCLAAFHVAAAVVATQLRGGPTNQTLRGIHSSPSCTAKMTPPPVRVSKRLRGNAPLGIITLIIGGLGAIGGGVFGGLALAFWGKVSPAGIVVGASSAGVLGAFCGALLASFLSVSASAWKEAASSCR